MAANTTTTSPPSEEITSLIAHEAYATATERISRMEFVSLDDTGPKASGPSASTAAHPGCSRSISTPATP